MDGSSFRKVVVVTWVIATTLTLACQRATVTPPRRTLNLIVSSTIVGLGEHVADRLRSRGVDVDISVRTGNVRSVKVMQQGQADIVFTAADAAYHSLTGELDPTVEPFDRLRGIAILQLTPIILIVRAESGIHHVSDLPGHRVNMGNPDSSAELMARATVQAFGIDPTPFVSLPSAQARKKLVDGMLDALFLGTTLDGMGLKDLMQAGARPVPVAGRQVDELLRRSPFFRPAVVRLPSSAYRPIQTFGVDSLFVCRADLDETLVYEFTKSIFEVVSTVPSEVTGLPFMNAELAPATPIPLHEGAARYYREREMSR